MGSVDTIMTAYLIASAIFFISIALSPAPPEIAVQMYNQAIQTKMIARMVQNKEPVDRVLAWAEREIEGFKRG